MKNKRRTLVGSALSKSVFVQFFITLVIYFVALIAFFIISRMILSLFSWQTENLIYQFFKWIDNHTFEVIILCGLFGFAIIFTHYWRKTLGYIDTIAFASESLTSSGDELIRLPSELKPVEDRMNQVKQDAVRSARLAREAEQRKNDLIVYLAHDIKTPLTSVIGYLSLLDEAPDMPPEQKAKYINITLDKAYRLEQLINEFFEITRYNLQTIALAPKTIDLYYMLVQMADEFYPQLCARGKQAVIHADEDLTVYGDPDKLARVFNNILKNAMAYSEDHSVIDITAKTSGSTVSIAFQNAGTIPKEKLLSIFEKFYRLDDARSTDTGGAGLGLAIAKEIVTLHGGNIFAKNRDGFTTFTVALPATLPRDDAAVSL